MLKRKTLIILIPILLVSGLVIYKQLQTALFNKRDSIRISGNIEITDTEVSFKTAGRVEKRLVNEGETVKAGQLVAKLDTAELVQDIALRRAEVDGALSELAELEAGSRPEEIAQAEAAVRSAQADAQRSVFEHARQKELHAKNVASSRDYDLANATSAMAEARLSECREKLELLKKGPRKEKIDQARARLEQHKNNLSISETKLGYAALSSPLSGLVLSENVEAGEYVAPGTPVVTIGDLENVWLRGYINETDLGRVKAGQAVNVSTDSYPDKIYDGRITFISSEAEFTPKNVQTQKERVKLVFRIKVDIPNPDRELKPGMPADGEILLAQPPLNAKNQK